MDFLTRYVPLIAAAIGIVASLMGIVWYVYTFIKELHSLRYENKELLRKNDELQHQLDASTDRKNDPGSMGLLAEQLTNQLNESKALEIDFAERSELLRGQVAVKVQQIEELTAALETAKREQIDRDHKDDSRKNLIRRIMQIEGRVYERKVSPQIQDSFRPLSERRVPIISLLNLKGGVGKTTVTAHLAAALSDQGYNVLMVDLDLQGSLSSMFIPESRIKELSSQENLLQHLLTASAENGTADVLQYRVPLPILGGSSAIVPTADSLAYAELNLTIQWLLGLSKKDNRFLLRKALHQESISEQFNVVLLDCPPLFNTCCVNALAASDYVIIPTVPSRKSSERVPQLLYRLQTLIRVVNPDLKLAGILLNRPRLDALSAGERDDWSDLLQRCQTRWGQPVPCFRTHIKQTAEVKDYETEFCLPERGSILRETFSRLVAELEERIPRDYFRPATTPLRLG